MTAATRGGALGSAAPPVQVIRLALETLPVGVFLSTAEGDWCNAELRRIWRHDGPSPLTRRAFARGLEALDESRQGVAGAVRKSPSAQRHSPVTLALSGRVSERARFRLRRTDGTTAVVVVSAVPLLSRGAVVGAVALIADVSARYDVERLRDS